MTAAEDKSLNVCENSLFDEIDIHVQCGNQVYSSGYSIVDFKNERSNIIFFNDIIVFRRS